MKKQKIRILVVEDERIVALDLQSRLQILGYDVITTVATGAEAIETAEQSRPDLVLMDIMLKGEMDGITAAEQVRGRLAIPVIYLTACADEPTLQRAKITEPFGYILKPYDDRELHGHIEIALYKHSIERRLRESEERYSLASQGANDGLWDWNLETDELYFSSRWKLMIGCDENEVGRDPEEWFKRLHPDDRRRVRQKIEDHRQGLQPHFEDEYRILHANGTYRWMLSRGLALRDRNGHAYRMAGSQTDITDRKVYDPLTGLPNRTLLMDRLERALERTNRREEDLFAVMAVDVDNFKLLTDSLGYRVADNLLLQVSQRLQGCISPHDTIAHVGENDFVLLGEEIRDAAEAARLAGRIQSELTQPFYVDQECVSLTATIGIAVSGPGVLTAHDILRDAYTAQHRAKGLGHGQFEIFDKDMRSCAVARLRLEADLRHAIERGEFEVYYQPIISLNNGEVHGFEALVRWRREDGLVLPGVFIPVAEATDLIVPLERWILRTACATMREWPLAQEMALALSVNLSAKQYSQPDLVDELKSILQTTRFDSRMLKLEITETVLMENNSIVADTLSRLQDLKIQVHMDDFGTGYSSLSYLHQFPIKTLKIDRRFVAELGVRKETRRIVQTIVNLAHDLSMEVTAEGIETLQQLRELQALGCDHGQGYYFSPPVSARDAEEYLEHHELRSGVIAGRIYSNRAFEAPARH
jgi:diguanylate cyclase (GGDEF)-like protein/PAS domain S-box-containing protein